MKKNIAIAFSTLVLAAAAIITLSSFTSHSSSPTDIHTHVSCEGKHCTGTVGCGCYGFAPIAGGTEYQKTFCRHCGHHRSYHR